MSARTRQDSVCNRGTPAVGLGTYGILGQRRPKARYAADFVGTVKFALLNFSKLNSIGLQSGAQMTIIQKLSLAVSITLLATNACAATPIDDLTRCFSENTNGKDRKALAKWIFVSLAAHTEMGSLTQIPRQTTDDATKVAGLMLTRLIADSCPREMQAAIKADGPVAAQPAFNAIGQLAMQELMLDKNVTVSLNEIQRHMDMERIQPIMNPK